MGPEWDQPRLSLFDDEDEEHLSKDVRGPVGAGVRPVTRKEIESWPGTGYETDESA